MRNRWLGLMITGVVILLTSSAQAADFKKGPYLLFTDQAGAMTVRWQTDSLPSSSTSTIAWGLTPDYELGNSTVSEDVPDPEPYFFSHPITGLPQNTLVYYQVNVDGNLKSGSFRTRPSTQASKISFYGYGDIRGDATTCPADTAYQFHSEIEAAMMQDVRRAPAEATPRQTLLINAGDFVRVGLTEPYWDIQYFNPTDPLLGGTRDFLANISSLGAIGNHEGYILTHPDANTCTGNTSHTTHLATAGKLYYRYWPYPMYPTLKQAGAYNDYYYSVDYGPAKFLFLDTSFSGDNVDQLSWFNSTVDTSTPWNIAIMHHPVWAPEYGEPEEMIVTQDQFNPIFIQNHIPLVIQGHVHYYARMEKDGIVYLVLGGGGAALDTVIPPDYGPTSPPLPDNCVPGSTTTCNYDPVSVPYVKRVVATTYSFARFDIDGDLMNVTVFDKNLAVLDEFSVRSQPLMTVPRPPTRGDFSLEASLNRTNKSIRCQLTLNGLPYRRGLVRIGRSPGSSGFKTIGIGLTNRRGQLAAKRLRRHYNYRCSFTPPMGTKIVSSVETL
jgi:hypothetical protein